MKKYGLLAVGMAFLITGGCATQEPPKTEPLLPNITAELNLGASADSILSKYGKPLYKKGRVDADGKKLEDWFYADSILSFNDGNLTAFKPK